MTTKLLIYLVITCTISATIAFLSPQVAAQGPAIQIFTAFASATFLTEIGAIYFFLTSLRVFKRKLKVAYSLVALGILAYTLFAIPSLLSSFGLSITSTVQGSLAMVPYIFGSLLIYIGMRTFTKQLAIQTIWRSFWFIIAFSGVLATLVVVFSRSPFPEVPETVYDVLVGLTSWSCGLNLGSTLLSLRIRRELGSYYQMPMLWLTAGLASLTFSNIHEIAIKSSDFFYKNFPDYFIYIFWPYLLTGVLLLGAGLAFKELSSKLGALPEKASYFDIISYVAQMISNPTAVDPVLDKMREITSRQNPNALTVTDKQELVEVYLQLETYLVEKDPLIKISREDLRLRLPEEFQLALKKSSYS